MAGLMLPRFALLIITISLMFNVEDREELVKNRYNNFSPFSLSQTVQGGKGKNKSEATLFFFRKNSGMIQKV